MNTKQEETAVMQEQTRMWTGKAYTKPVIYNSDDNLVRIVVWVNVAAWILCGWIMYATIYGECG